MQMGGNIPGAKWLGGNHPYSGNRLPLSEIQFPSKINAPF